MCNIFRFITKGWLFFVFSQFQSKSPEANAAALAEYYQLECEAVASGRALRKRFADTVSSLGRRNMSTDGLENDQLASADLFLAKNQQNPVVAHLTDYAARAISAALGNVVSILSPSAIMLGSVYPGIDTAFLKKIEAGIQERGYPFETPQIQILPSQLGEDCIVIGSLVLALEAFQTSICC